MYSMSEPYEAKHVPKGQERIDPKYCYYDGQRYAESLTLNEEGKRILRECIRHDVRKIKGMNYKRTSYGMKHAIENYIDFYISNADLKKAMVECGFTAKHTDEINWLFNAGESSPAFHPRKDW